MDLEDFEENLRALDRTLSELQIAKRKSSQIDDQTRLDSEIESLRIRKRDLLAARTEACGGARELDTSPSYERGFGLPLQEYTLLGELKLAGRKLNKGVYIRTHPQTSFAWDGVIFIHSGIYEGACFKFSMRIPPHYPDCTAPRFFFQTQVTHPMIHETTGEVKLGKEFPKWDPLRHRLWHVIRYVYSLFFKVDTSEPMNEGASALYKVDEDAFKSVAQKCAKASIQAATINVGNNIDMHPWEDSFSSVKHNLINFDRILKEFRTEMPLETAKQKVAIEVLSRSCATVAERNQVELEPRLKKYIHTTLGKRGETTDTDNLSRKWLLINEYEGFLILYKTEREEIEESRIDVASICSCQQDNDSAFRGNNMFQVVCPSRTLRCSAPSANGLQVWLSAIIHAMSLRPGDAIVPELSTTIT
eukprot:gene6786-9487_t